MRKIAKIIARKFEANANLIGGNYRSYLSYDESGEFAQLLDHDVNGVVNVVRARLFLFLYSRRRRRNYPARRIIRLLYTGYNLSFRRNFALIHAHAMKLLGANLVTLALHPRTSCGVTHPANVSRAGFRTRLTISGTGVPFILLICTAISGTATAHRRT